MTRDEFKADLDRRYRRANRGTKAWSTAFHTTFGVSAIAGVLVAVITGKVVLQIGEVDVAPYVPFIAVLGSICSAIGGFGGFERKWQANRITRNEIDILGLRLAKGEDVGALTDQLIGILRVHDAGILQGSAKPVALPPQPPPVQPTRIEGDGRFPPQPSHDSVSTVADDTDAGHDAERAPSPCGVG